ncbi:MAG: chemotaxis protein CheW [Chthonomonadaceae bacterium]|nr:chemotaxis protein CheW [Chthonomonadaceae bacterium]
MNEEMSQYLGLFLDEASEQLELLEHDILLLEQDASPDLLDRIFRAAHTLKGSSRAMGFTPMGELTHALEDVFDRLRQQTLSITRPLIDALFAGLDSLKEMREQIATSGQTHEDTAVLCARLRSLLGRSIEEPRPIEKGKVEEEKDKKAKTSSVLLARPGTPHLDSETEDCLRLALNEEGGTAFWIALDFAQDCLMKSVRAMLAINSLNEIGQVLITEPIGEEIEAEGFSLPLYLLVQTSHTEAEVSTRMARLSETVLISLTEWHEEIPLQQIQDTSVTPFSFLLSVSQQEAIDEAHSVGERLVSLRIRLADDCVMKSIRALMVMNALEAVGSVIALNPDEEALEAETFEQTFDVLLATQVEEALIRLAIERVSEATCELITDWKAEREPATNTIAEASLTSGFVHSLEVPNLAPVETPDALHPVALSPARPTPPPTQTHAQTQTVRVDVARLDKLLNLIGELVIDRTRIAQLGTLLEQKYGLHELIESMNETATHVGRITDELQSEIMKARLIPIDTVFNRFPRMIRDLAQKLGKEVEFVVEGKETELDRSVVEIIGDPLVHMLRNSVDHGIETPEEREDRGKSRTGTVTLRARHQENHIVIEIEDDGKGMSPAALRAIAVRKGLLTSEAAYRLTDREALQIIFAPGFSTAAVVSEVSGRGVGMDIVKSNLERLGAIMDIQSEIGEGSRFTIKLPLTLAIIRGLLVKVAGGVFALPLVAVQETLRVDVAALHRINGREVILQRGHTLPIIRLDEIFDLSCAIVPEEPKSGRSTSSLSGMNSLQHLADNERTLNSRRSNEIYLVIVGNGTSTVGLVVDRLIGEQEVVIKTLGKFIGQIAGISGATILGDGRVALIADINGIIEVATERNYSEVQRRREEALDAA